MARWYGAAIADQIERVLTQFAGELEVDDDAWPDHDENVHGTIDTDAMRKTYPENFIWSCCDLDGTVDGCQTGRHEEKSKMYRRVKR